MKIYSAHDYLAGFEPWLLEDISALPDMLEDDTRRAEVVAYRLLIPINADGRYPVEVWVAVIRWSTQWPHLLGRATGRKAEPLIIEAPDSIPLSDIGLPRLRMS